MNYSLKLCSHYFRFGRSYQQLLMLIITLEIWGLESWMSRRTYWSPWGERSRDQTVWFGISEHLLSACCEQAFSDIFLWNLYEDLEKGISLFPHFTGEKTSANLGLPAIDYGSFHGPSMWNNKSTSTNSPSHPRSYVLLSIFRNIKYYMY